MVHKHPNGDGYVENMFIQFPLMLVCINYIILCNKIINMLSVHKSHGRNIITCVNYSQSTRADRPKCRWTSTASSSVTSRYRCNMHVFCSVSATVESIEKVIQMWYL